MFRHRLTSRNSCPERPKRLTNFSEAGWRAATLTGVPRHAWLAWSWALIVWAHDAAAQPKACPATDQAWIKVVFGGSAWAPELREAVVRELGVELARRSLQVCGESEQATGKAPDKVVTLLANEQGLVSILPADLQSEGGFVGRTVQVGAIPEDARALAIAQAIDEALRSESSRPSEPVATPAKQVAESPPPQASPLVLGVALAPALQIAPATFDGAKGAVVAPGALLRLSLRSSSFGGSLGVAITRTSQLDFGHVTLRQFRLPLDCSIRWRLQLGEVEALMDLGVLAALVDYQRGSGERGYRRGEIGGRAGVSIGWGRRVVPWLGVSVEVLPSAAALKLAPTGNFGRTPQLWLGLALGTEVRWP